MNRIDPFQALENKRHELAQARQLIIHILKNIDQARTLFDVAWEEECECPFPCRACVAFQQAHRLLNDSELLGLDNLEQAAQAATKEGGSL